jgi:hypothetical protein
MCKALIDLQLMRKPGFDSEMYVTPLFFDGLYRT